MAVDNIVKSRQRHASNLLWMTAMLEYFYDDHANPLDQTLTDWTAQLVTQLSNETAIKFLNLTDNPELIGFRKMAYTTTNGMANRYSVEKVQQQIEFEIKCLPAQTLHLSIETPIPHPAPQPLPPSRLNRILTMMYLTRKFVAICEEICDDERMQKYLTPDQAMHYTTLWAECMRVRSSTFSTLAPLYEDSSTTAEGICKWSTDMVKFYKEWGKKAGAPFYGNRRYRNKRAKEMHRDDPLLSAWAGTHKVPVDSEKSVLGMVERVYNLPERCDISGTTTDAVAYGIYTRALNGPAHPDLFVFLNIYGMMLSAHHSLFETCAGASLWASKYYAPFEPLSILNVLGNLRDHNGKPPGQDRFLKTRYDALKTVVTTANPGAGAPTKIKNAYWYVLESWQEMGGINLPGIPSKTRYWGENLEMSQALYVMAEKLCSLAHNVTFET